MSRHAETEHELRQQLHQARVALATYAKRSSWTVRLGGGDGYGCTLPQPWRVAAAALGIDEGYAPSDMTVAFQLLQLEGKRHG